MPTSDPGKPLLVTQWGRALKRRPPKRVAKPVTLQMHEHALPKAYRESARLALNQRTGRIQLNVRTRLVGQHFFPPDIKSMSLSRKHRIDGATANESGGRLHDHLGVSTLPAKLARELRVRRPFLDRGLSRKGLSDPTTVFNPDERYTFSDTAFPWCTSGKVETEAGWGSGVMIGPRHMMTASHVVV